MIQIWVEIPHEPRNIAQSIKKCLVLTLTSFLIARKSNMWGVLFRQSSVLCIYTRELEEKKQPKSSKMRQETGANDLNDICLSFD